MPEDFSVEQAAEYLGVSVASVRKYVAKKQLNPSRKVTKFGPQNVFTQEQLDAFKAARESEIRVPTSQASSLSTLDTFEGSTGLSRVDPNALLTAFQSLTEALNANRGAIETNTEKGVTMEDAAARTKFPRSALLRAIKAGELRASKPFGRWIVDPRSLDEFFRKRCGW